MQEALSDAAASGDVPRIRDLLGSGAKPDAPDRAGFTALHRSCVGGSADAAAYLLAAGASANATDVFGDAPLHYAAFSGHVDIVRALLAGGGDPGLLSHDGRSPLSVALAEGHVSIVEMLLRAAADRADSGSGSGSADEPATGDDAAGAGAFDPYPGTANVTAVLCDASFAGDVRTMYRCLLSGVDVNTTDPDGISPLHRAAAGGNTIAVELLIDHGADVNARDPVSHGPPLRRCDGATWSPLMSHPAAPPLSPLRALGAERLHASAFRLIRRQNRGGPRTAASYMSSDGVAIIALAYWRVIAILRHHHTADTAGLTHHTTTTAAVMTPPQQPEFRLAHHAAIGGGIGQPGWRAPRSVRSQLLGCRLLHTLQRHSGGDSTVCSLSSRQQHGGPLTSATIGIIVIIAEIQRQTSAKIHTLAW